MIKCFHHRIHGQDWNHDPVALFYVEGRENYIDLIFCTYCKYIGESDLNRHSFMRCSIKDGKRESSVK